MGNGRAMLPHNIYSFLVQWSANLRSKGRLMILYFFIWYSLVSPAAGREGGRKSRGTPPTPRPWDCVPRHPLLIHSAFCTMLKKQTPCGGPRRGEKESGDTPEPPAMGLRPPAPPATSQEGGVWVGRHPRPWDCVPPPPEE